MIDSVAKVIVPVDDQERAFGEERWIEVAPPGGGPVLHRTSSQDDDGTRYALGQW